MLEKCEKVQMKRQSQLVPLVNVFDNSYSIANFTNLVSDTPAAEQVDVTVAVVWLSLEYKWDIFYHFRDKFR